MKMGKELKIWFKEQKSLKPTTILPCALYTVYNIKSLKALLLGRIELRLKK